MQSSPGNHDVSVVILTRNSVRTIEKCLEHVIAEKPGEIIAVDAGSVDGTIDVLKRFGAKILNDAPGLGHQRQAGVEAAKGTCVMFVDSDMMLSPGCIAILRAELEMNGWVGNHLRVRAAENSTYWQRAEDENYKLQNTGQSELIGTAAGLFRRAPLLQYPFDPTFKESFEDVDLSRRLIESDHRLGVSTGVGYHYHRRDFIGFALQRFRGGVGRARFAIKYGEIWRLVDPLVAAYSRIIRNLCTRRIILVPYWTAGGFMEFLGVLVGLSRIHRELSRQTSTFASPTASALQNHAFFFGCCIFLVGREWEQLQ